MAEFKEHFKKVLAETFNEMTGKSTIEDPTTKDPTAEDLTEAIARQIDIKTSSQDATSIKGKVVDDSEIGDGKALVYSGVKDKIIYKRVGRGFIGGAIIGSTSGTYKLAPSYTVYKADSTYYAMNSDGGIPYSGADAATVIQVAHDALPTSGGEIFLKEDFDAGTGDLTITKSNVTVKGPFPCGQDSGSEWWRTPRIGKIILDSSAATITNVKLENLNTRHIDFYANGHGIINTHINSCGIRTSSSAYPTLPEGIRYRGTSIVYFVWFDACHFLMNYASAGHGFISYETVTGEGTGQHFYNKCAAKAAVNSSRLFAWIGRSDQIIDVDGLSFVEIGKTGVEFLRAYTGSKLKTLNVHDSIFEMHEPATLFNFEDGGTGRTILISFNHNKLTCGDTAGDVLTLINNAITPDADYVSTNMHYFTGHGNRIVGVNGLGTFAVGTTGADVHFKFDVGYVKWEGTAETNNVATYG